MLKQLMLFELKYHGRQMSFLVALLLFAGLGFLMSKGNFGGKELHRNAPYVISYIVSLLCLMSIFTATIFCANVVLRDTNYSMEALIHSSGIRRWQWFVVRLTGLVTAVFLLLVTAMPGCWLGWSLVSADQLGAFSLKNYTWPLLIFGLPDVFFCCSLVFAAAVITQNARSVYTTGVLLFVLYFTGSILGNSPLMAGSVLKTEEESIPGYLTDPFGIMSFFGETRNWTVIQRNEELFPLAGTFLLNRLLWLIISFIVLFSSFYFPGFRIRTVRKKKRKTEHEKTEQSILVFKPVTVFPSGAKYNWQVFLAQLRLETRALFRHLPFLFLLGLWIFLFAIDLKEEALEGPYGIRYYAVTGFLVEKLRSVYPALFLLVFYASEMLHREKSVRIHGLVFSTTAPGRMLWLSKAATLLVLVLILVSVNICIGIGMQLVTGTSPVLSEYAQLYYLSAWPVFLFAILILLLQVMVRNKFLSMMLSLIICGVFVFSNMLGIRNLLLRYATLPDLRYSAFNGFGHYAEAVNWYILYWSLLAVLLAWFAAVRWQTFIAGSLRLNKNRKTTIPILCICAFAWLSTGAYIYHQSANALNKDELNDWKYNYEIKYGNQRGLLQPVIITVSTQLDLYPEEQRYHVKGHYRLRNETSGPIQELWLGLHPDVNSVSYTIPGGSLLRSDEKYKQYWFKLERPIQPGAEANVNFSMDVDRNSFNRFNSEHSVVSNGTYIELEKYIPVLGYNPTLEIDDLVLREKKKLPPQHHPSDTDSSYHFIDFETVISTSADQQAVTVGKLMKNWKSGNRNYFHYKSESKIPFMIALSSARYALLKQNWNGTQFSVYYQTGQEQNLQMIMQAMKDAIDYGKQHFSNYPSSSLSLAVIPHYPGAATAYPGVIFSAEKINCLSDFSDSSRFNTVYTVTAHETAHQWWADILSARTVPGRAMLTESLAKYTELMVSEKFYGSNKLRTYLERDHQLYFNLRNMNSEQELPVIHSDQSFVYYQKGGLMLYAIKNETSEAHMNTTLQNMLLHYGPDHYRPSPEDFYHELLKNTTTAQQRSITDKLQRVLLYDAGIKMVSCKKLNEKQWELILDLSVVKWDHTHGKPVKVLPNDTIELSIFEQEPASGLPPVQTKKILISREQESIKILLEHKPVAVVLDPFFRLLDENRSDNEWRIHD